MRCKNIEVFFDLKITNFHFKRNLNKFEVKNIQISKIYPKNAN